LPLAVSRDGGGERRIKALNGGQWRLKKSPETSQPSPREPKRGSINPRSEKSEVKLDQATPSEVKRGLKKIRITNSPESHPKSELRFGIWELKFGAWSFSGAWSLEPSFSLARVQTKN